MNRYGILLLGVGLLGGCASMGSNEPNPTELRLRALEATNTELQDELSQQQRRLSGLGAVGLGSSVANLEEQVRTLRGQIEDLQYRLEQQNERQRALYVDIDNRLQQLEGGESIARSAALREDDNADQKAYLAAFQQLKSGSYDQSIKAFQSFLKRYPESPYAPNAQYWVGEAHYVDRNFEQAWLAFAQVLKRFPASGKASDALLKQGLVRVEQGKQVEARELLKQVSMRYPNSTAAGLARERLQQMGSE
ncbi:MAG: tol-pal system protein YbgF [Oceanococcus sp.]